MWLRQRDDQLQLQRMDTLCQPRMRHAEKKPRHAVSPGERKVNPSSLRREEPIQSQGPNSGSIQGPESSHPGFAKFRHVSARIRLATHSSDEKQSTCDWHAGRLVLCVAFAGGGDIILSASYAHMMIWYRSAKQGRSVMFDYRTIPSAVDAVAVSPSGLQFATGRRGLQAEGRINGGGTVEVWDVATQSVVRTLQGYTTTIQSLAFSPNETKLASGSWYGEIQIWDLTAGEFMLIKAHNDDWVCSLAFSPDGSYLLSGSADMTARIWDARNGRLLRSMLGHTNEINSVGFSADSTLNITGSDDRTVRLWEADTEELIQTFIGHSDWIHCVAISPEQRRIASGSDDGTIRLWDASSGEILDMYDLHDRLWSIAFSPDSKSVISGAYHGKVHLRKMEH
ncbi:WD40-repeat-containing domain superfamily protein [Pleurotus pulmonarius]